MKNAAFQLGALLAALIVLLIAASEGTTVGEQIGWLEPDPVLVFVIPQPESAAAIRRAVPEDRVVWKGEAGLALVGDRVLASDLDGASTVIKEAGWMDKPIQIVRLEAASTPGERDEATGRDPKSDEARLARLRSLVHKPTLTRGEQLFVLQAMADGLEI